MITIVLPLPHKALSPNARVHWATKAKKVKDQRWAAKIHALNAIGVDESPRWKAATVQCRFYFAINRQRDEDNLQASMKSAFDGLADAGVIQNDSGFKHLPVVIGVDKLKPRVEIDITETVQS